MNTNNGLPLVVPRITPVLDAKFRPAALACRAFRERLGSGVSRLPVKIALEQADGSIYHYATEIFKPGHALVGQNYAYVERLVKFLLWSRGACRIYFTGPKALAEKLQQHFRETPTGKFDSNLIGERVYERAIEVVVVDEAALPPEHSNAQPLGRHLKGCRIGFDLGGSDRKVAAVKNGKVEFSLETVWDPYFRPDPQYHIDGIMDSLKRAAAHLPRVDAIGGSAAGVYVNSRVMVSSLFRGVPQEVFDKRVKNLFLDLQKQWGVPMEVVNDGE